MPRFNLPLKITDREQSVKEIRLLPAVPWISSNPGDFRQSNPYISAFPLRFVSFLRGASFIPVPLSGSIMDTTPRLGDPAPDFTLTAQDGTSFRLSDEIGRKPIVLFFYPKDDTLICTREACAFREAHEAFRAAGALVAGISADPPESHKAFAERHRLPFLLLTDPKGETAARYGVPRFLFFKGRMTFVIDTRGRIRLAYGAATLAEEHSRRALDTLRRMRDRKPEIESEADES